MAEQTQVERRAHERLSLLEMRADNFESTQQKIEKALSEVATSLRELVKQGVEMEYLRKDLNNAHDGIRGIDDRVKKIEEEMPEAKIAKRLIFTSVGALLLAGLNLVVKWIQK